VIPVSNIVLGTYTFEGVFDKIDELADIVSLYALTANDSLGLNEGNAYLDGNFSSEGLYANVVVRGGNNSVSKALPIGSDGFTTGYSGVLSAQTSTTANTAGQTIDSFPMASYRGAEYLVQAVSSVGVQLSKILVTHDGNNAFSTEFGTLTSNGSLGTFGVSTNSTAVALVFNPVNPTNVVRFHRTGIQP